MNANQAYEAYCLECAKRDGFTPYGNIWKDRFGCPLHGSVVPDYISDGDIDRVVRFLSDYEMACYCVEVAWAITGFRHKCYSTKLCELMMKATTNQKRMALYKVFGIEVTE